MFGDEESMNRYTGDLILDEEYKRTLRLSIFDGLFFAIMFGMGEYYIGAYAVFMGATAFQLGFLWSLPLFLGSCAQLACVKLTNKLGSRKKLLVITSFLRTLVWIPIILSYFMGTFRVWVLVLCMAIYYVIYYLQYSPWLSWMGDLVDEVARPKYFALRTRLTTTVTFLGIVAAGLILEYVYSDNVYLSFMIVFIFAFLGSFLSFHLLSMKMDVPFAERPEDKYDLAFFSKRLLSNVFGKYTVFNIIFYFGIYIATPFFIAYQLNVLEFTYIEFMIATSLTFAARALFFRAWANLTERHGNINILIVSVLLVSLVPFGWFFAYSAWHVYVLNFLAGMAWAGFDILNINLIYDSLQPSQRSRSVSYLTFYKGIAIFIGGIVGSFLMREFAPYVNEFFMVFFVSGIVRVASVIYFKKEIKEIKKVDPISHTQVIVQLFGALPREGSRMLLVGFKTAKSNFIVLSDQSKKYIEHSKKRQHRKKNRRKAKTSKSSRK